MNAELEQKIKERTAALRESEEKYHFFYDSLKDGIVRTDMEGRIVECNLAYREMLGYTEEDIKRLTYQHLTPEK